MKIPESFGTHDGTFHADEVTACALLLMFNRIDPDKIYRTREPSVLERCEYVCDVGGSYDITRKVFDHHQVEYQGPLSSAGMVLRYLKESGSIDAVEYEFFNRSLIMGVDAHDNGQEPPVVGYCSFSNVVSNFNPVEHGTAPEVQDRQFGEAVNFVLGHLIRLHDRFKYIQSCREIVAEKMKNRESCLLFEESVPWLELFFELGGEAHPARFIIMPGSGFWKLRAIPPTYADKMKVRHPLPQEWAGLHDDDLKKVCGIQGAIFCHKGRFISVWETKEAALEALRYVLEKKE